MRDTFIAGIALAKRATLATRNTCHFDALSVCVVNPCVVGTSCFTKTRTCWRTL